MRNVHERLLPASAAAVGALLDGLGGPDDVLWPSPEWSPMWLDGPAAVGTAGGHGALRYRISAYVPGRQIVFTLDPGQGLAGWHGFDVVPLSPERTVLRHTVVARLRGRMRVLWPCVVRSVHDGIVEQILDRAELALGAAPAQAIRLGPVARLARWASRPRARATVPSEARAVLPQVDYADAFAVRLRPGMPTDPAVWASAIFHDPPRRLRALFAAREALVGLVGFERATRAPFAVQDRTATAVVVGADARHLDFRAVVAVEPARVVVTTVVRLHNRRGRAYFALVRRIHPTVVAAVLTRAATRLSRAPRPAVGVHGPAPPPARRRPRRGCVRFAEAGGSAKPPPRPRGGGMPV